MKKIFYLIAILWSTNQYASWTLGNIHIFGDSHSVYSFTNNYTSVTPPTPSLSDWPLTYEESYFKYNESLSVPFIIHWISNTMHEIGRSGINGLNFRKHGMLDKEIALLTFGGMDFYHGHIERQYMKGRKLEEIVQTLTGNFIAAVLANRAMYENITIIIMGAIPPCIFPHNKNEFVQFVPKVPYELFIAKANRMLNESLASHCKANKLLYLNVNAAFATSVGTLDPKKSDGQHHVKPSHNHIIKKQLVNLILGKQ